MRKLMANKMYTTNYITHPWLVETNEHVGRSDWISRCNFSFSLFIFFFGGIKMNIQMVFGEAHTLRPIQYLFTTVPVAAFTMQMCVVERLWMCIGSFK